ncbi:MAG: SAM hydroxide adenosyltransferase, partial [Pirellulaceae bacterium]
AFSGQGNLVTSISAEQLAGAPRDERLMVRCDEHETNGVFDAGHAQPASTLIAVLNGDGQLELEIVGDSAKLMLGVPLGEAVEVRW